MYWQSTRLSANILAGWKAPRNSAQLVYPDGLAAGATDDEINISFCPTPNYAALAEAAAGSGAGRGGLADDDGAWMRGLRVRTVADLKRALEMVESRVIQQRKGMLLEVML